MNGLLAILEILQIGGPLAEQLMNLFLRAKAGEDVLQADIDAANAAMNAAVAGWDNMKAGG